MERRSILSSFQMLEQDLLTSRQNIPDIRKRCAHHPFLIYHYAEEREGHPPFQGHNGEDGRHQGMFDETGNGICTEKSYLGARPHGKDRDRREPYAELYGPDLVEKQERKQQQGHRNERPLRVLI